MFTHLNLILHMNESHAALLGEVTIMSQAWVAYL